MDDRLVLPKRSSVARLGTLALSGNFSASATWPGGGASGQRGPSWLHAPHRAAQSSAAVQPPARKQSSTRVLRKLAGTVGCQLGVACGTCSQAPPSLAGIPSQGKHHSAGNSRTLRPPCACLSNVQVYSVALLIHHALWPTIAHVQAWRSRCRVCST